MLIKKVNKALALLKSKLSRFKPHILTIYLGKTIVKFIAIAAFLLLGIELLFSVVNELRVLGTGDYQLKNMFQYLALIAPQKIVKMFPVSALLGTLLGLGSLANHSELVVMRAQGLSILNIIGILLKTGLLLVVIMWGIGEIIVPYLEYKAESQKALALNVGLALETKQGIWMRDGQDFVHIRGIHLDGRLEGITRYQFDKTLRCEKISYAAQGYYRDHHWMLYNIEESQFNNTIPATITHQHWEQKKWDSVLSPSMLTVVGAKNLEKLSLRGLWKTIQYRKSNHLETKVVELIFWNKIAQPFVSLLMIIIAVPCIFGPLRQAAMGLRLLTGLSLGFSFYIFVQVFSHIMVSELFPPVIGVFLPILIVFIVALLSIRRLA